MDRDFGVMATDQNGVPIQSGSVDNNATWNEIRVAAILTNGAVDSSVLDVGGCSHLGVGLAFAKGSLTNVIIGFEFSADNSLWRNLYVPEITATSGTVDLLIFTVTLTATLSRGMFLLPNPGASYFKAKATGTGTVTSSSLSLQVCRGVGSTSGFITVPAA